MSELCNKLPERYSRLRAKAYLTARAIAATVE